MKRLLFFLLLLGLTVSVRATVNVSYTFTDFTTHPTSVSRVTVTPLARGADYAGAQLSAAPLVYTRSAYPTLTNGTLTVSNLIAGYAYRVEFSDGYSVPAITNYFASSLSGNVDGNDYKGIILSQTGGAVYQFAYYYQTNTFGWSQNFATTNNAATLTNIIASIGGARTGMLTNQFTTNAIGAAIVGGVTFEDVTANSFIAGPGGSGISQFKSRANASQLEPVLLAVNNPETQTFMLIGPEGGMALGQSNFPGNGNLWASGTITGAAFNGGTFTGAAFNGGTFTGNGAGLTNIPVNALSTNAFTLGQGNWRIVTIGNSIDVDGFRNSRTNWMDLVTNMTVFVRPQLTFTNFAQSGYAISNWLYVDYTNNIQPLKPASGTNGLLVIGGPEVGIGDNINTVKGYYSNLWRVAKLDGWHIVQRTGLITTNEPVWRLGQMQNVNNWLRGSGNYVLGAPRSYDLLLDAERLLPNTSDSRYFADALHPLDAGAYIIASEFRRITSAPERLGGQLQRYFLAETNYPFTVLNPTDGMPLFQVSALSSNTTVTGSLNVSNQFNPGGNLFSVASNSTVLVTVSNTGQFAVGALGISSGADGILALAVAPTVNGYQLHTRSTQIPLYVESTKNQGRALDIDQTASANNVIADGIAWSRFVSGGVGALDTGAALAMKTEDNAGNMDTMARLRFGNYNPTNGAEESFVSLGARWGGAAEAEVLRVQGNRLLLPYGTIVLTNLSTAPEFPTFYTGGAMPWSDGTNLCVTIKNPATGTLTTNKLTMSAWP